MKKFIVSILFLCTIMSFTACGKPANNTITEADLETMTEEEFENALEALDSTETSSEQEDAIVQKENYEAAEQILNATWDSGLIQINDKLVQLPLHLDEWMELGFDYEISSQSKDYLFNTNDSILFSLTVSGEEIGYVSFTKTTEGFETLESINPLIEKINIIREPLSNQIFLPGGLTFSDSFQVIEEKLGKATEITDDMMYKYGHIGFLETELSYGMNILVNRDTQKISGVEIAKNISANSMDDITTITFNNVPNIQTGDVHNVSFLFPGVYKQVPGILADQPAMETVMNYEGTMYFMNLYLSMLGQQYASPYDYLEYGDPILDTTDETGMNRKVYNAGYAYIIVCSTDVHILKAVLTVENMNDSSADSLTALQEFTINIANSIQF